MATVTKSIGTSSRDYSTITLWEADLDDSGIYSASDDAVGECYNDSAFDESVTINGGGTIGLSSITLTVASADRHDGTAGTGANLSATSGSGDISCTVQTTVSWLEIDVSGASGATTCISSSAPLGESCSFQSLLLHGISNGNNSGAINGFSFIATNCIVYDCNLTSRASGRYIAGINLLSANRQCEAINCTIHDIVDTDPDNDCLAFGVRFVSDDADLVCKNTVATGVTSTGTAACFNSTAHSSSVQNNNASSDATAAGTGSLTSITTANQYVSTTGGSEDLHLKANADLIRAGTDVGTTPANVNIDIDGTDRDAIDKTWSIGAHEWYRTTTLTIGTTGRDYSTFTLWDADMDSHSNGLSVGDDVVADIYDDSTFSETLNYNGATNGYDSVTFKAATGERHDGTAGTGVRNIVTGSFGEVMGFSNQPNLLVEGIEVGCSAITDRREILLKIYGNTTAHNNARISKCLVHDAYQWAGGGGIVMQGFTAQNYIIENCIVYDWGVRTTSTTQYDRGAITSNQYSRTGCQVLNCTVYNVQSYDNPSTQAANCYNLHSSILVKNCIGVEAEDDCFYGTQTQTTNMSSDATASGVTSVTTADQFVSTTGGSEDLHLKAGSDAIDAGTDLGTTPTGVNFDIDGRDRDSEGDTWDIGAHEFVAVASNLIKRVGPVTWASIKRLGPVVLANLKKVFNQDT